MSIHFCILSSTSARLIFHNKFHLTFLTRGLHSLKRELLSNREDICDIWPWISIQSGEWISLCGSVFSCTHRSLCAPCSRTGAVRRHTADRTPVPEPDTPQTKKAPHLLLQSSDLWTGEALPPTEIPGQRRAGRSGQESEDDGRTSQDLVPEPQDQVEVGMKGHIQI